MKEFIIGFLIILCIFQSINNETDKNKYDFVFIDSLSYRNDSEIIKVGYFNDNPSEVITFKNGIILKKDTL